MELIDIPTEQTTAATDAVLGLVALAVAGYLSQRGQAFPWKTNLWLVTFGVLAVASFLGTVAHGFKLSESTKANLWVALYLSLGVLVALFVVAAIYDLWGLAAARRALPLMLGVAAIFFGITLIWPDSFLVFIIYEAVAMLFALGGYLWLATNGHLAGAWWMVGGILVTIIAAGVQASSISFTLIWPFDHNGVYHLVQLVGVGLLLLGLRVALLSGGATN